MRSVRDIPVFENIPILVRAALNVPVENGVVINDYRLRRAVPTIRFLAERGARVILISHLGELGTETLAPVAEALGTLVPNTSFLGETIGPQARSAVRDLPPGHVLVLENLRRHAGEKANDPEFAKELAALADAFVQDSFDTCHRRHASIIGVPQYLPSYGGLLVEEEVGALRDALSPARPSLAVIGGAKFATKEGVLAELIRRYDALFVGGALANDFFKARGGEVGRSLVSGADAGHIDALLENPKLVLPLDMVVIPCSAQRSPDMKKKARVCRSGEVRADEVILDVGPETSALLAELAKRSHMTLWNGPLGNYENGFADATDALARSIAASSARSIVGGGDTIASIERLGLLSEFSFVSTGGGAMLDFIADGSLPGIEVLAGPLRA